MENLDHEIQEIIIRVLSGEAGIEDRQRLIDWLGADKSNIEMFSQIESFWNAIDIEVSGKNYDPVKAFNRFEQLITKKSAITKINKAESNIRVLIRYAAVVIFTLGLSLLGQLLFRDPATNTTPVITVDDQIQVVDVPYGSKSRVVLPDGSEVILNSGSVLRFSNNEFSSDKRSVDLTGEGFFNVKKNSAKLFYVNTPGMVIQVQGTTFNVKAYPDEESEEATLITGKVAIYPNNNSPEKEKPIILKPNQKAVFLKLKNDFLAVDSGPANTEAVRVKLNDVSSQSTIKTEQIISWKENTLVFDNELFSSLIKKIERWYNVTIMVNNPELNSARFTGKFDKETLEQVLNALVTVTPFNYNIKKNMITITK